MDKTPRSARCGKLRLRKSPRSPIDSGTSPICSTPSRHFSQAVLFSPTTFWAQGNSNHDSDVVWDVNSPSALRLKAPTPIRTPLRRRSAGMEAPIQCKKKIVNMDSKARSNLAADLAKLNELVTSEVSGKNSRSCQQDDGEEENLMSEKNEPMTELLNDSDEVWTDDVLLATQSAENEYLQTCTNCAIPASDGFVKPSTPQPKPDLKNCDAESLLDSSDDFDMVLCKALDNFESTQTTSSPKSSAQNSKTKTIEDDFLQPEVLDYISQMETQASIPRRASTEEIERKKQDAIRRRREKLATRK